MSVKYGSQHFGQCSVISLGLSGAVISFSSKVMLDLEFVVNKISSLQSPKARIHLGSAILGSSHTFLPLSASWTQKLCPVLSGATHVDGVYLVFATITNSFSSRGSDYFENPGFSSL